MTTPDRIAEHVSRALGLVEPLVSDLAGARTLLALLGWDMPPGVDIGLGALDLSTLRDRLRSLHEARIAATPDDVAVAAAAVEVSAALRQTVDELRTVSSNLQAPDDYLARTRIRDEFVGRLLDLAVVQTVVQTAPTAFAVGNLLGLLRLEPHAADPDRFQVEHVRHVVHWDRLGALVDPARLFADVYGWGTAELDSDALIVAAVNVLRAVGVHSHTRRLPRRVEEQVARAAVPEADDDPAAQAFVSLVRGLGSDPLDVGVSLFPVRPTTADAAGIGVSPFLRATQDVEFAITDRVRLAIDATLDVDSGLAVVFRPGSAPTLRANLNAPAADPDAAVSGQVLARLTFAPSEGETGLRLLSAPGLEVRAEAAAAAAGVAFTSQDEGEAVAAIDLAGMTVAFRPPTDDGLLRSLLPADGLNLDLDVALRWTRHGLQLGRAGGLSLLVPRNLTIGPVVLRTVAVELAGDDGAVAFSVQVAATATIGPLTLSIDGFGVAVTLTEGPGNIGPIDLDARLTRPSGLGLAIDAGPVVGGGTLRFDPDRGEYDGVAQLQIGEIGVHAVVLVTTGGRDGLSVLVMITADGFTPISLGFGFVLTDVGGLLAFNRTVDDDVLRAGLRDHTLDAVLFPKDPARNAATILRTLRSVFPPRDGGVLLGPMALITWGVPPLLHIKLAAIIELSSPVRLVVLAQLRAALPSTDHALVVVNMDALGVLNVDEGTLAIDAVLYDSHMLGAAISGEMALRARWRTDPTFVMAIGGFNPRFPVPAGFPHLRRMQVQLTSGDNPRVRLEAYLALTSNTVQVGAHLDLHVRAAGFSIDGDLGFDALIGLSPFELTADMHAGVTLKWHGRTLLGVRLDMTLTGPTPWHAAGKATFKVWKFSKSVRFDKTFGRDEAPPLPPPIDPLPPLIAAVADRRSWAAQLPGGDDTLLRLTDATASGDTDILVHPLGTVTLRQRVVPLDVPIDTFGARRVSGDTTFSITAEPTIDTTVTSRQVRDHFAPAQYFEMDDTARLATPSFELMDAGLELSGDAVRYGGQAPGESDLMTERVAEYDTCIKLADGSCHEPPDPYEPPSAHLPSMVATGPAARAPVRTTGEARFRAPALAVEVASPTWTAATTATLEAVEVGERDTSYTAVRLALVQRLADHPEERGQLQIVTRAEVIGATP